MSAAAARWQGRLGAAAAGGGPAVTDARSYHPVAAQSGRVGRLCLFDDGHFARRRKLHPRAGMWGGFPLAVTRDPVTLTGDPRPAAG